MVTSSSAAQFLSSVASVLFDIGSTKHARERFILTDSFPVLFYFQYIENLNIAKPCLVFFRSSDKDLPQNLPKALTLFTSSIF